MLQFFHLFSLLLEAGRRKNLHRGKSQRHRTANIAVVENAIEFCFHQTSRFKFDVYVKTTTDNLIF